jgi:hypothetical protein
MANSYPGSAPRLEHRVAGATTEDARLADELRATHRLIKGRYFGGRVGYVWMEDLPLFAAACRRPLQRFNDRQQAVVRAFEVSGPLSPRQLREQTGLPHKLLMGAVNRLEEAFIVCEDQTDEAWDRPLHLFEREWPEAHEAHIDPLVARKQVFMRWAENDIVVTMEGATLLTGWPKRQTASLLLELLKEGELLDAGVVDAAPAYLAQDKPSTNPEVPKTVRVMHRDDPLVRPMLSELKRRYSHLEVLKYLLIDDRIGGAVCGHWRISPHDVEDIVIDDEEVAVERRAEILQAVLASYPPPERQILQFAGEPL